MMYSTVDSPLFTCTSMKRCQQFHGRRQLTFLIDMDRAQPELDGWTRWTWAGGGVEVDNEVFQPEKVLFNICNN